MNPSHNKPSGFLAAALLLGALTIFPGCAALQPAPESVVEKKAAEYWQARRQGQLEDAYALTAPSYRKLRTLEQFRVQFGNAIADVQVVKVSCEPEKCTVRVKIGMAPVLERAKVGTIATHLDEVWLLEDGQWWRHHDL